MKITDIKKAKITHDNRVGLNYQIQPGDPVDLNTDWKCLNISRERMGKNLGMNILDKSFEQALDTAEGVEIFTVFEEGDKEKWKVILKNLKDNWQEDSKYINAPLGAGFEVGNTVTWDRLGMRWLLVWQDYNINEYFRGEMQRATHMVRWKNQNGKVMSQWASVQGPIETRAKYEQTRGNVVTGRQNDTIEIWMGSNSPKDTDDLLRYDKIKIGTRVWRVHVRDDISNPEILRFSCVEDYENLAIDDMIELIPGGLIDFGQNTEAPKEEGIRIVGPSRLKEKLVSNFYAINEETEEIISSLGTWEVVSSGEVTSSIKEDGSINVTSQKLKNKVELIFYYNDQLNSITLNTASMLS